MVFPNVKTFINPFPYNSQEHYLIRTKENNMRSKYIDESIDKYLESGIHKKLENDLKDTKYYPEMAQETSKIYTSVNQYVDDYDFTVQLKLGNYYYLFFAFLMFNFILFLIFLIDHLIVIIYSYRRKIMFSIKNRLIGLYN